MRVRLVFFLIMRYVFFLAFLKCLLQYTGFRLFTNILTRIDNSVEFPSLKLPGLRHLYSMNFNALYNRIDLQILVKRLDRGMGNDFIILVEYYKTYLQIARLFIFSLRLHDFGVCQRYINVLGIILKPNSFYSRLFLYISDLLVFCRLHLLISF